MMDLKFQGFDAIQKKAAKLQREVRDKLYVNAGRAGARVIAERAKQNVMRIDDPVTGRSIANNIAVRYRKRKSQQTGDVIVSVGVLYPKARIPKGNPDDGKETPHWHLIERGTEHARAQPFLVPAAIESESAVVDAVARNLDRGLTREVKKL